MSEKLNCPKCGGKPIEVIEGLDPLRCKKCGHVYLRVEGVEAK